MNIQINTTGSPGVYYSASSVGGVNVGIEKNHKYFVSLEAASKNNIDSSNNDKIFFPYYSTSKFTPTNGQIVNSTLFSVAGEYKKGSAIITAQENQDNLNEILGFRISGQAIATYNFIFRNFLVCDLTRMFGSGNEPKDVESFEKFLENFEYDYKPNYGNTTLKSIEPLFLEAKNNNQNIPPKKVNIPSGQYFKDGMKSLELPGIKLVDKISFASQKAFVEVGSIDLGSMTWEYYFDGDKSYFRTKSKVLNINTPDTNGNTAVMRCIKYNSGTFNDVVNHIDNVIACNINGIICVWDQNLTKLTSDQLQQAFSGVLLYYKLNSKTKLVNLDWKYEPNGEHSLFVAPLSPYYAKLLSSTGGYEIDTYDNVWNNTKDKTIAYKATDEETTVYLRDNSVFDVATLKAKLGADAITYANECDINPKLQALPMPKTENEISCYNYLLGRGPFDLDYYSNPEGTHGKESGFITSYERRRYMGKTVTWNQLIDKTKDAFPKDGTVINGLTVTNTGDGTFSVDGTASANTSFSCGMVAAKAGHKYLICGCSKDDTAGSEQNNNYYFGVGGDAAKQERVKGLGSKDPFRGVIFEQTDNGDLSFNCWVKNGYVADRLVFKPQVFDLTEMFGSDNKQPATPAEFWSYFPNKVYPYNPGETQPLFKISRKSQKNST